MMFLFVICTLFVLDLVEICLAAWATAIHAELPAYNFVEQ